MMRSYFYMCSVKWRAQCLFGAEPRHVRAPRPQDRSSTERHAYNVVACALHWAEGPLIAIDTRRTGTDVPVHQRRKHSLKETKQGTNLSLSFPPRNVVSLLERRKYASTTSST